MFGKGECIDWMIQLKVTNENVEGLLHYGVVISSHTGDNRLCIDAHCKKSLQ